MKSKYKCEFCSSERFERWEGSHGLEGTRCKNCKSFSSYIIFQDSYHQIKPKRINKYDKRTKN